jgi:glucose dehydrogenase
MVSRQTFPMSFPAIAPQATCARRLFPVFRRTWTGTWRGAVALWFCASLTPRTIAEVGKEEAAQEWSVYRGDAGATQFAELAQINAANVHQLRPAWHAGREMPVSAQPCTPIRLW